MIRLAADYVLFHLFRPPFARVSLIETTPLMERLRGAKREVEIRVTVGWANPETRTSTDEPPVTRKRMYRHARRVICKFVQKGAEQ